MTPWVLIKRSLIHHWRTNIGVVLASAVATAVLAGALVVGDSVRDSLRNMALSRLGDTQIAVLSNDRLFRAKLADALEDELRVTVAPALRLIGSAALTNGEARAHSVQVMGVDHRFWTIGGAPLALSEKEDDEAVILNTSLAMQLDATVGSEIVFRIDKPDALSRDAPLSPDENKTMVLRLKVKAIADDSQFGRFNLYANQVAPLNAFVSLPVLQKEFKKEKNAGASTAPANRLLVAQGPHITIERVHAAFREHWTLDDAELELKEIPTLNQIDLRTARIFLDTSVGELATKKCGPNAGLLTYLVNGIRGPKAETPYSMVTGVSPAIGFEQIVPQDMKDDEIVVNNWLAEDQDLKVGDTLHLRFYVMGRLGQLIEKESEPFRVSRIVPLKDAAADKDAMPDFPGLSDADNCQDWDTGFTIDQSKIRTKDEDYWDEHRGTPKAYITLQAAQSEHLWKNRFGAWTSVRFPQSAMTMEQLRSVIKRELDPTQIGFRFEDVRTSALAASREGIPFDILFLSFSFFLIVAALLLTGLLFAFGIEQRTSEVGILCAVGFPNSQVRRLLLVEGALLALLGAALGTGFGMGYAKAMLYGLATIWRDAVQSSSLQFHYRPVTLALGLIAGQLVSLLAIWLVLRKQATHSIRTLLAERVSTETQEELINGLPQVNRKRTKPRSLWLTGFCISISIALVLWMGPRKDPAAAGAFFGAGSLMLIGSIALGAYLLELLRRSRAGRSLSVGGMGIRNAIRHRIRSLTTLGLLACGTFLVVAVGANRQDPSEGAEKQTSGTGGTAFFGMTAQRINKDLNTKKGRELFMLNEKDMADVSFIPLRLREGDDASCLNLNKAQRPQLWAVEPALLAGRFTFTGSAELTESERNNPWLALERSSADGVIPAIGDLNTVLWGLQKSIGSRLRYQDEQGRDFEIEIVGTVATSILQGSLIISETAFQRKFPSAGGYRIFLIDTPSHRSAEVGKFLTRDLADAGLALTPSVQRLAEFNAVQNTYLSTFLVLGGLGLLLGSIGLGLVVLRNVLERRSELALLRAIGFRKSALRWLVASEHGALLLYGMFCGVVSAAIAVIPALRTPGAEIPYAWLTIAVGTVLASGLFWTWAATVFALHGPLLPALRGE